jgi:hypothetical protein
MRQAHVGPDDLQDMDFATDEKENASSNFF